ncbi:MAG: helicase C-terminal domain-containing protein [Desulfotomaculaceae bacterium]|nr:helicase C-terminal domain-containing protein [Desulfotomaculaceae bacterium]
MDNNAQSTFVVCDLETTGLNPVADKIIEIGLVRLEDGEITGRLQTLVNPKQPLHLRIKRLTGITDQDLAGAPELAAVLPEILDFIGDSAIAGHNVDFDLGFLAAARGRPFHNPSYDTLELARIVAPGSSNYRLSTLCRYLKIDPGAGHRALDDAVATAHLLAVLINKLRAVDLNVLVQLNSLLAEAHSRWHGFTAGLVKDSLRVFPDRKIASTPYWRRQSKDNKVPVYREQISGKERVLLDADVLASLVGRDGLLAQAIPGYEYRPQQEAMIRTVTRALNEDKYLLLEAGTGIGKSMAYLLPAVAWSIKNKERVLIATNTINLQEQLWHKDIPLLASVIQEPFRVALAKGRQNYICLRRWQGVLSGVHQPEEAAFYARVLTWLSVTETGDRTELNVLPGEGDYWVTICGDADGCLGSRCRYLRDCFVNKARKEAEEADLIITNHSLLFTDINAENRVLPAYGPLIIDEAHHLEDSATAHLGRQVSQSLLTRWLGLTGKTLGKLTEIAPPDDGVRWRQGSKAAQEIRLETSEAARLFFQELGAMATNKIPSGVQEYSRTTLRLPDSDTRYGDFLASGRELVRLLRKLTGAIMSLVELMELWSIAAEEWDEPARDLLQVVHSGTVLTENLLFILESSDKAFVYWADLEYLTGGRIRYCTLLAAPINVGELLFNRFFKNKSSVVFTSATLSVNDTFEHFIERSGLNFLAKEQLAQAHFDSPFAYEQQALLCINRDLPAQGAVADGLYLEQLEKIIAGLVGVTGGKTLVLFTSHRTLRETYHRLKTKLENMDICLLGHGIDGSRSRILEEFRMTERSVLFGASSFWEGVDVPGEALTCVVMVKLPFWSPKVPVVEARLEDLARRNRDGFRALSVPQAVIRFKQGFGRLIRSGSDRGCVVVLDARILSKSYGRQFLRSLPLKSHIRGGSELIHKKLADWLALPV